MYVASSTKQSFILQQAIPFIAFFDLRINMMSDLMRFLVKEKIVHIKLVDELLGHWVIKNWETIKPLVYGWRKQYDIPESYHWFEYLYNEMKKREQQQAKIG